ncbi:MAG: N-acyl homoserine lactonase family protein [Deltaproteobacteria bacterium]|nr:N-acyl homoserine lactonase family protein [Deltaproteobacteria bacterium]
MIDMMEWKDRFKTPVRLKLHIMHTGEVHAKGNIHFNPKSPKFKSLPKEHRFNPVFSFLVVHPSHGPLLLDTGLHHSFNESRFGNFGPLLGTMVRARTKPGKDVRSQLDAMGIRSRDIRYVLLSHLHLDHPGGLSYFAGSPNAEVFVDKEELKAARAPFSTLKGYVKSHLAGIDFLPIPYDGSAPPFEGACDFFGDGSVLVVRTSGHTKGHSSVILNAMDGPIILTFDAVHRRANLDEGVPPVGEYLKALSTMRNIESFLKEFPHARVVFGHDPDQLMELKLVPEYYT